MEFVNNHTLTGFPENLGHGYQITRSETNSIVIMIAHIRHGFAVAESVRESYLGILRNVVDISHYQQVIVVFRNYTLH